MVPEDIALALDVEVGPVPVLSEIVLLAAAYDVL
jgi:hypothetical protein